MLNKVVAVLLTSVYLLTPKPEAPPEPIPPPPPPVVEEWKKRIFDDLLLAKAKMEHKLDYSPRVIAYPYGDYNQEVVEVSKEVGYEIGLTTNPGLATPDSPIYELPRTYIRPNDDMAYFFFKIKNITPGQ